MNQYEYYYVQERDYQYCMQLVEQGKKPNIDLYMPNETVATLGMRLLTWVLVCVSADAVHYFDGCDDMRYADFSDISYILKVHYE